MTRPWVFGIGISKSGGHSLAVALRAMGLRVLHLGHERHHGRGEVLEQLAAQADSDDMLAGANGVDALIDWPVFEFWRTLRRQNPEAKFILTYRPPHDCALSWCRQLLAQPELIQPSWVTTYSDMVRHATDHVSSVLHAFLDEPHRLLVLDMRDDDETKWALLAKFLGRPAARAGMFPHEFDHRDWQQTASGRP